MPRGKLTKAEEEKLLNFLTDEERKVMDDNQKKMDEFKAKIDAQREIAVRRQKTENEFWKKVRERKDEVLTFFNASVSDGEDNVNTGMDEGEFWRKVDERKDDILNHYRDNGVELDSVRGEKIRNVCALYGCDEDTFWRHVSSNQQASYFRTYINRN